MIGVAGLLLLMLCGDDKPAADPSAKAPKVAQPAVRFAAAAEDGDEEEDLPPELETLAAFAKVRRIYVDILTGGESAGRIRDLLMSSIQASKLFIVTEEEDKADAVLKGAGHDQVFTDTFQSSDSINAHSQMNIGMGNNSATNQKYSDRNNISFGAGESENRKTEERKHEAIATVRLVNKNGDVIWSATEESLGAKFVGASVDVVAKIAKKLAADYRQAKAQVKGGTTGTHN
jgi:hypothetical protein